VKFWRKTRRTDAAQTGLILALFDAENKTEAESEMAKSLEANPNNLFLLVGAAYWYAAREQDGASAIELAEKAVNIEPRYTWARIALARGLMQQKRSDGSGKDLCSRRGNTAIFRRSIMNWRRRVFSRDFTAKPPKLCRKSFRLKTAQFNNARLGGRVAATRKVLPNCSPPNAARVFFKRSRRIIPKPPTN
jgi:tetratricopeptide (TPR) repeat protein